MGKVYQTLPLYENLKTTGVYVYGTDYDVKNKTVTVNLEAQVRNETADSAALALSAAVVDADGVVRAQFAGAAQNLAGGQTATLTAAGPLQAAHFWDINDPYLYDVYSILSVNGKVADVCKIHTGFRKAEFQGRRGHRRRLAQRSFRLAHRLLAALGQRLAGAGPGLSRLDARFQRRVAARKQRQLRPLDAHFSRSAWMSPPATSMALPTSARPATANTMSSTASGSSAMEVMRDSMIYFRNHPSILFWEAGNSAVIGTQMQQMVEIRKKWDPNGGRVMGCRSLRDPVRSLPRSISASCSAGPTPTRTATRPR